MTALLSGSEEKVKEEGGKWEVGRGWWSQTPHTGSHHRLRISTHVALWGHSAGSDTCSHSSMCLTAHCGSKSLQNTV